MWSWYEVLIPWGFAVFGWLAWWCTNVELKHKSWAVESERRRRIQAEYLREIDTLTGLVSQSACMDRLDKIRREVIRKRKREREDVNVIVFFLDLDQFKQINDEYGHSFGNTVLASFGERLQHAFPRAGDLVARWAGDEFVIAVKVRGDCQTVIRALRTCVRRIRKQLHFTVYNKQQNLEVGVRCSAGYALLVENDRIKEIAEVIEAADASMYREKEERRH